MFIRLRLPSGSRGADAERVLARHTAACARFSPNRAPFTRDGSTDRFINGAYARPGAPQRQISCGVRLRVRARSPAGWRAEGRCAGGPIGRPTGRRRRRRRGLLSRLRLSVDRPLALRFRIQGNYDAFRLSSIIIGTRVDDFQYYTFQSLPTGRPALISGERVGSARPAHDWPNE